MDCYYHRRQPLPVPFIPRKGRLSECGGQESSAGLQDFPSLHIEVAAVNQDRFRRAECDVFLEATGSFSSSSTCVRMFRS